MSFCLINDCWYDAGGYSRRPRTAAGIGQNLSAFKRAVQCFGLETQPSNSSIKVSTSNQSLRNALQCLPNPPAPARRTKPTATAATSATPSPSTMPCTPKARRRSTGAIAPSAPRMVFISSTKHNHYCETPCSNTDHPPGYLLVYPKREDVVFQNDSEARLKDYFFGKKNKPHRFCPECSSSVLIDFKNSDVPNQRGELAINVSFIRPFLSPGVGAE